MAQQQEEDDTYFFPEILQSHWDKFNDQKKMNSVCRSISLSFFHLSALCQKNDSIIIDTSRIPRYMTRERGRSRKGKLWKILETFRELQMRLIQCASKVPDRTSVEYLAITADFLKACTLFAVELLKVLTEICGSHFERDDADEEIFETNRRMMEIRFCELEGALSTNISDSKRDDIEPFISSTLVTTLVLAAKLLSENWAYKVVATFGASEKWKSEMKQIRQDLILLESCFSDPWSGIEIPPPVPVTEEEEEYQRRKKDFTNVVNYTEVPTEKEEGEEEGDEDLSHMENIQKMLSETEEGTSMEQSDGSKKKRVRWFDDNFFGQAQVMTPIAGTSMHGFVDENDTEAYLNGRPVPITDLRWKMDAETNVFVPSENYDPLPKGAELEAFVAKGQKQSDESPGRVLEYVGTALSDNSTNFLLDADMVNTDESDRKTLEIGEGNQEENFYEAMGDNLRMSTPGIQNQMNRPIKTSTKIEVTKNDFEVAQELINELRMAQNAYTQSLALLKESAKNLDQNVTDANVQKLNEEKWKGYISEIQTEYLKEINSKEKELRMQLMKNISKPEYRDYFHDSDSQQKHIFDTMLPPLFFLDTFELDQENRSGAEEGKGRKLFHAMKTATPFGQQQLNPQLNDAIFNTISIIQELKAEEEIFQERQQERTNEIWVSEDQTPKWSSVDVDEEDEYMHNGKIDKERPLFENVSKLYSATNFAYISKKMIKFLMKMPLEEFSPNTTRDDQILYLFDIPVTEEQKWFVIMSLYLANAFGTAWMVQQNVTRLCKIVQKSLLMNF